MFVKELRLKSKNQIKSSEKKNVLKDILQQFPLVDEEKLKEVFKIKESEIALHKLIAHDGTEVQAYFVDNIPYVFKIDRNNELIPTVYFLWKFPDILPKFYTHRAVFSKLANGADLMLPGVIVHGATEINLYTFRSFQKNQLCTICLDNNTIPVAIGKTALSGEDMYMSGMRGKCTNIIHIYKDNLWALGDQSIIPPVIPLEITKKPEITDASTVTTEESNDDEALLNEASGVSNDNLITKSEINTEEVTDKLENLTLNDELLHTIFLTVIKFKPKEFQLPIIVSTFMKLMQNTCPPNLNFDLKQTSYKKFSSFLTEMQSFGCIEVRELQKGVLSICNINKEHESIKNLRRPTWLPRVDQEETIKENYVLDVVDMYRVTGNVEGIFQRQYRKGDLLSAQDVRQFITAYIKEADLQDKTNKRMVKLNDVLRGVLKGIKQDTLTISFEELFNKLFQQFTPMHYIIYKYTHNKERESPILKKGKFRPVEFKLESRGGNKKLTSISNLDEFPIDVKELQQKIRTSLGCSVSMVDVSLDSYTLTVQGNQIHLLSDLLKREYGIQLKHMQGLELAVKD